jgi:hypothetical protein
MNCEEFELRGLDLDRADAEPEEAALAAAHAKVCARCGALLESWQEVKSDLQLLREATRLDSAPARVEMRLKQELRTRREARVPRSTVAVSAWGLAAAAVLLASVGWVKTRDRVAKPSDKEGGAVPSAIASSVTSASPGKIDAASVEGNAAAAPKRASSDKAHANVAKDDEAERFTLLPGSWPSETEEAAIVRVRMQRGALGALGLPVNEERAGEWIQVDLLVGNDGLPQAVRLAR